MSSRLAAAVVAALTFCALAFAAADASAAAPTIVATRVADVTTTSATLEAEINPGGKAVKYHFEYGPADCSANPCTKVPFPKEGTIKAEVIPVGVSAPIEGLTPGTTYHLRTVAENASTHEVAEGQDRTFATRSPQQTFGPCPNDAFRAGANLPDCRAYEQATPVDKNGGDATNMVSYMAASESGDRVTFLSDAGFPGGEGSQEIPLYVATRGAEDWSTQGVLPPGDTGEAARVLGWSPDLSQFFDRATRLANPLSTTFLARSSADGAISTVFPYGPGATYSFAGSSPDGSIMLFETGLRLNLPGVSEVYVWDRESGQVRLVSVMNDGSTPAEGAFAGPYGWASPRGTEAGGAYSDYYTQDQRALAADGSAAYFTVGGSGQLYVRLNPTAPQSKTDGAGNCTEPELACTVRVSRSRRSTLDPVGSAPAAFQAASADGTKAFFTSSEKLTDDANTGPEQAAPAIERSDLEGNERKSDLALTHATGIAIDSEHVYWVDPVSDKISRAKLDGTGVDPEFITATEDPKGIAVANGYIYWTNGACVPDLGGFDKAGCVPEGKGEDGTIGKAKLNGDGAASEVDQNFVTGVQNPWAVTANSEHVYWTSSAIETNTGPSFVGRALVSGAEPNVHFLTTREGHLMPGIALDSDNLYWSEVDYLINGIGGSAIERTKLDGTAYTGEGEFMYIAKTAGDRSRGVRGIAVQGGYVYWAAQGTSEIGRAPVANPASNIFPSDEELEFIKHADHPYGIAADASHLYWSGNSDATPLPNPGNDLYRYDTETKQLDDLVADPGDENGAEVKGVLGTSEDGSYVYFAANGDLDGPGPSGPATPGDCSSRLLSGKGACNVYLWHEGEIHFVARLEDGETNWVPAARGVISLETPKTSRVTPDGRTLLFASWQPLTGYDSEGATEFFRYHAPDESLICVTCNPTGEAPSRVTAQHGDGVGFQSPDLGSISVTAWSAAPPAPSITHVLSDDGNRVFFETTDSLSEADTNDEFTTAKGGPCPMVGGYFNVYPVCKDVYEWEAEGTGTCKTAGGCQYLLSRGTEEEASLLDGVSASGNDVFIATRAKLVGRDTDIQRDIYDVRVGGGLASQYPQPEPICEGEACKPAVGPPAPIEVPPAFSGPGNPTPACPKGKRRAKDGRCVGRKHQTAKKHHKQKRNRANPDRRTQR
jgi:hypothetical protein